MKSIVLMSLIAALGSTSYGINNASASTTLDTKGTIYYDHTKTEVDQYYKNITEGDKGEALLTKLQTTLSKNQKKVTYGSGHSTNSKNWNGYYLYERNYDLSPLQASELNGNYKTSGIWVNSLYVSTPIYIVSGINSSGTTYKYLDANGVEQVGTFKSGGPQFDREHVFPKSFGFNYPKSSAVTYKDLTAGCDAHNLHIGEHNGNSDGHSNLPFGVVKNKTTTTEIKSSLNGELVGYRGLSATGQEVFEPLDKDKGDIARTIFYMAARYHTYEEITSVDKTPALRLGDNVRAIATTSPEETKNSPVTYGQLSNLLEWNILDPVDKYEVHRNNLVYNAIQFNRNPFVDYPDWAEACFRPQNSTGVKFDNFQSIDKTPVAPQQETYNVNLQFNPSQGKVTASKLSGNVGEKVTITIAPNEGYEISKVTVNGNVRVDNPTTFDFTTIKGANDVVVEFKIKETTTPPTPEVPSFNIALNYDITMGKVEVDKTTGKAGELIKLVATPNEGYELLEIIANGVKLTEEIKPEIKAAASKGIEPKNFSFVSVEGQNNVEVKFNKIPEPTPEKHDYKLTLKTNEKFKNKYYCLEQFDPSGFEVELYDGETKLEAPKFELYSGAQILTSDYTMLGVGQIDIRAYATVDGVKIESTNVITITLEISKTQLIIIASVGVLLLILIISFIVWACKRKNRKKVKYLENKVEKIYKKSKKKRK